MILNNDIRLSYETCRILDRGEDFIYLLPHLGLHSFISNYTITFPSMLTISDNYTIVPHGSAALVFSCDGKGIHANLFGPSTKPCTVGEQANQCDMIFIIEFQPAGSYSFTGANQKELSDQIIPFELINSKLNRLITEILYGSCSLYELVSSIDKLLLANTCTACPSVLNFLVGNIIENRGNLSVKELSGSVFYSERHLNRIFNHYLGMCAKTFSRLVRINKAVRILNNPRNSIINACNSSGFYDLPHFIHEFKSICGHTPQEYKDKMSDFYSEIAKF